MALNDRGGRAISLDLMPGDPKNNGVVRSISIKVLLAGEFEFATFMASLRGLNYKNLADDLSTVISHAPFHSLGIAIVNNGSL